MAESNTINQEELAICRRRGHQADMVGGGWAQCRACGMWLREKRMVEEREDEPPEDEMDSLWKLTRRKKEAAS